MEYIAFNEVGVTIACLAGAFTFVVLTWNCIKAIKEWIAALREPTNERIDEGEKMLKDHEERISHLEECCSEVKGKLASDWKFQQEQTEVNKMVLKSLKSLLQHAVDGNDTKNLEQREQEIDKFLLDHMK